MKFHQVLPIPGKNKIEPGDKELGGLIRHNGWTLHVSPGIRLTWPVYPSNSYQDEPETELSKAIGRLSRPFN